MKGLARSYIFWPSMDSNIEHITKTCMGCFNTQNMPSSAPLHPWEFPDKPWSRIHVDFAGPFMGHMFLVVIDAHSKWPEVVCMQSTTSERTIEVLREIFSRNGLYEQLVSDNGPKLTSSEFMKFMKINGIKHIRSVVHHPSTNGQAENFVKTH